MADFKLNGITPDGVGKIKLGSVDVQKIYMGSTLVWPSSVLPPGQVEICDLIWTTENSTITDIVPGSSYTSIPIAETSSGFMSSHMNGLPVAAYWQFDPSNSEMGLLYNQYAARLINPPAGFRLPSQLDFVAIASTECNTSRPNQNRYGADPGIWSPTFLTNTTELGDTTFNVNGYGYGTIGGVNPSLNFTGSTISEHLWTSTTSTGINTISYWSSIGTGGYIRESYSSSSGGTEACFIRFVKDA